MKSKEEIDQTMEEAKNHENKKVKGTFVLGRISAGRHLYLSSWIHSDWAINKMNLCWILPGFCKPYSLMTDDAWSVVPDNTNINESAHAATNHITGTRLPPLEAILA